MPFRRSAKALHAAMQEPDWRKQWPRRRRLWQTLSRLGLTGLHSAPIHRNWLDVRRLPMPLVGLDPAFEGLRLVQISDLHVSPFVWRGFVREQLRHVADMRPDLLVVTGDLISGGFRYTRLAAELLAGLHPRPPMGIVCTLGNHDYGMNARRNPGEAERLVDRLAAELRSREIVLLRNEPVSFAADRPLTLVGLDDVWTGRLDAELAYETIDASHTLLCLNHDPKNARELLDFPWQWMLSGHTHGRQLAETRVGRVVNKSRRRPFVRGHYEIAPGRHLYVNRGLSYGQRWQSWCKPEITVFKLRRA
ncbi:MAG: metallophosphoesterase [Planctomycetota bacterium]